MSPSRDGDLALDGYVAIVRLTLVAGASVDWGLADWWVKPRRTGSAQAGSYF